LDLAAAGTAANISQKRPLHREQGGAGLQFVHHLFLPARIGLISFFAMVRKYISHPIAGENILELFVNTIVYLFTLLNIYYALRCSAVLRSIFQELDVLLKILANQSDVEAALRQIKILTTVVQV
jgi:hypothetical protein